MSYTTLISIAELNQRLANANLVIFDCRFELTNTAAGREAYLRSHLPGAHYAHLDDDLSGTIIPGVTGRHPLPDPEDFMRWLGSRGVARETQVVIYDQWHGGVASRLWWMLKWVGHEHVAVLDGGWEAYLAIGLPLDEGEPDCVPQLYEGEIDQELVCPITQVHASPFLVDARAAVRYRGEHEPIDPVAGHIPGAQNLPFLENLTAEKCWRSKEELRVRFESVLEPSAIVDTTIYCGSGVTACHNILALRHAGLGMAKLYPGSWSEWIVDPLRPIIQEG